MTGHDPRLREPPALSQPLGHELRIAPRRENPQNVRTQLGVSERLDRERNQPRMRCLIEDRHRGPQGTRKEGFVIDVQKRMPLGRR